MCSTGKCKIQQPGFLKTFPRSAAACDGPPMCGTAARLLEPVAGHWWFVRDVRQQALTFALRRLFQGQELLI
jgi:hypothetical protein